MFITPNITFSRCGILIPVRNNEGDTNSMVIGQQGSFFEIINQKLEKVEGVECHCHGIWVFILRFTIWIILVNILCRPTFTVF